MYVNKELSPHLGGHENETCILFPGQVRLETSIFPSINGIFDYQEHFLNCNNQVCFFWEDDFQTYSKYLNKNIKYTIGHDNEAVVDDETFKIMVSGLKKTANCDESFALGAISRSIKENYGLAKVFEKALETDCKYFIKSRYDLVFKNKFDINKYKFLLDNPEPVIIMPFQDWGHRERFPGCSTLIYFMNRPAAETMRDYNLREIENAKNDEIFCTEAGFYYQILKNKIHLIRFNFPVTFNSWHKQNSWYSGDFNTNIMYIRNTPLCIVN